MVDPSGFEPLTSALSRSPLVDLTGIEPVTSSLQMRRSTAELQAHQRRSRILDVLLPN